MFEGTVMGTYTNGKWLTANDGMEKRSIAFMKMEMNIKRAQ